MSLFFRFCLVLAVCVLFGTSVAAAPATLDTKMFSASGIKVDVTAENAAAARKEALLDGQKRALMIVMQRLTPDSVLERLPELVPDDVVNMVQDMSVSAEKTSSVRYMATLEIRFNADSVRKILKDNGLPFVRTAGKPLLILPLYKKSASASPLLFADDNAWLRAWINRPQNSYMVPLFVPMGELSDVQTLSAEQVVAGNLNAAKKLAKRYEAQGVLIAEMTRKGSAFAVNVRAMDDVTASEIPEFSFSLQMKKNTAQTFASAVSKIVSHIENVWKTEQMVQFNEISSLIAMVPVADLTQWQTIQSRLQRIPSVSSFELQAARTGVLQITVFYAEGVERLKREMQKRMLSLTVLPSGIYKLGLAEERNYFMPEPQESAPQVITPRMTWGVVHPVQNPQGEDVSAPAETAPAPQTDAVNAAPADASSAPAHDAQISAKPEKKGGMVWVVGP